MPSACTQSARKPEPRPSANNQTGSLDSLVGLPPAAVKPSHPAPPIEPEQAAPPPAPTLPPSHKNRPLRYGSVAPRHLPTARQYAQGLKRDASQPRAAFPAHAPKQLPPACANSATAIGVPTRSHPRPSPNPHTAHSASSYQSPRLKPLPLPHPPRIRQTTNNK